MVYRILEERRRIGMSDQQPERPIPQSNKCRICEERFSTTKYPVSLPCGHVLCMECEQGVSRMNAALCPFCRRRYANSDLRRIYNDAEAMNPHEELMDVASRIRTMVDEQSRQANEIRDLKAERDRLKAEKEQLQVETGISNLSMVPGPSGICQNCTRLRAEYNKLVKEHNALKQKNKLLADKTVEPDISSDDE